MVNSTLSLEVSSELNGVEQRQFVSSADETETRFFLHIVCTTTITRVVRVRMLSGHFEQEQEETKANIHQERKYTTT